MLVGLNGMTDLVVHGQCLIKTLGRVGTPPPSLSSQVLVLFRPGRCGSCGDGGRWMDGWMDGYTYVCMFMCVYIDRWVGR